MGLLSTIFGAKPVVDAVTNAAEKAADIVERWAPSDAAKHEMHMQVQKAITEAAAGARSYDPRSTGGGLFGEIVNVLVDAVSRMIRPTVTVMLLGAVFGWWPLATKNLDPVIITWTEATMIFWFGARMITKDIPTFIRMMREMR